MNLILLEDRDFLDEQRVRLSDARFQQIQSVHQSVVGDTVKVGKLDGLMGLARITAINDQSVELEVELNQQPPAKLPLTLLLALPRPKMARRILRSAAEMGVSEIILINSYRVDKSYWQSPLLKPDNIRRYLIEGLQQARDTVLPELSLEKRFKPFVEDRLPDLLQGKQGLLAHPGQGIPCPQPLNASCLLAVGPEGGFIPYEAEKLQEAGLQPVHLGARILKVETAVPTLIGKLYSC